MESAWPSENRYASVAKEIEMGGVRTVSDSNLKQFDISHEQYREYDFEGRVYRINNPKTLFVRPGGSTHRAVDADGVAHCVPVPGDHGCVLRWKNFDSSNPVNF